MIAISKYFNGQHIVLSYSENQKNGGINCGHDFWHPPTNKDFLAKAIGLKVYDCALPQDWLNAQPDYETTRIETVWCYDPPDQIFGAPVNVKERFIEMVKPWIEGHI